MNKKVRDQTDRCPMPKRNKTRHAAHEEEMDEVDDMDFVGCKNLGMKEVMMMDKMEEKVKEEEYPDDRYKMNHTHRGNAVILYHETFENKDLKTRTGVEDDVKTLKRSLMRLGFQVDSHKDLTYDEIKGVLVKVAKKNHSNNDCLLVAVMTHGRGRDYIHAKDEKYRTSELWETFNHKSCPTLEGKPKIVFVQAYEDPGTKSSDSDTIWAITNEADVLVTYCTGQVGDCLRGNDPKSFIQTLCKELDDNPSEKDLYRILTTVNRKVVLGHRDSQEEEPRITIQSKLTRSVYLLPQRAVVRPCKLMAPPPRPQPTEKTERRYSLRTAGTKVLQWESQYRTVTPVQ